MYGGFPRSFLPGGERSWRWMESFTQTFLERDIPMLGIKAPSETLRRFWTITSHYHGQIWNAAPISQSMSLNPRHINNYRDILSSSFMLRLLPPWFENLRKRQVKSPKIYFRDSGLFHYFSGIETMDELRSSPKYGASFEGFALEQVLSVFGSRDSYFWGTHRGAELDLLFLRKGKMWGFEFKCSDAPSTSRSMHIAIEDLNLTHLWVIYPGRETYSLGEKITALPLQEINKIDFSIVR